MTCFFQITNRLLSVRRIAEILVAHQTKLGQVSNSISEQLPLLEAISTKESICHYFLALLIVEVPWPNGLTYDIYRGSLKLESNNNGV